MSRGLLHFWVLFLFLGCGGPRPRPADEAPELVGVWYTTRPGDTVAAISARYHVPVEDIVELNDLGDPDHLEAGRALFLFGVDELLRRLPARPAAPGHPPRFAWPLPVGVLTSGFGARGGRMHQGIDIAVPLGTTVGAAADGTVIYSDDKQRGYGNLVIIRHDGGFVTVYAHNRRNLVDEGDQVRQGAPVAEVGNTGHSTGPHLHFEIRQDGEPIDPLIHLPAR
jgi:murein DD-endopeptidase MepM/ murein hydrolase activator NlpD